MIPGEGWHRAIFMKKEQHMAQNEDRVERLLNQLENPGLTAEEIELIEKKIDIVKSLGE